MEIKFRGLTPYTKEMVFGDLIHGVGAKSGKMYILPRIINFAYVKTQAKPHIQDGYEVIPESVGQFTGLTDKNGKEIYSGDIVKYFEVSRYVQQSHFDINPEIDEPVIVQKIGTVGHVNGAFVFLEEDNDGFTSPISNYGLYDLEELQKLFEYEEGVYSDANGTEINESILGLEIIGNVFQNKELINTK